MGSSFQIIKELIEWVEKYAGECQDDECTLEEFLSWLNSHVFSEHHKNNEYLQEDDINMELSYLLLFQTRHFKSYAKHALADHEISSPDSFSFLYHLSLVDSYRKMELVKMHMMEAPTGIEVLKRLLSKGLIDEFDDPDDKRATRVNLTSKGRSLLSKCQPEMQKVFNQLAGNMDFSEKLHFLMGLRKINDFHRETHKKNR